LLLAMVIIASAAPSFASSELDDQLRAGHPAREIIGFSEDGRYFAFEVFGYEAVAGSPFAELYVLDTLTNEMVGGSPFQQQLWTMETYDEYEPPAELPPGGLLESVRADVQAAAAPALKGFAIVGDAGRLVVSNIATEIARSAEFVARAGYPLQTAGMRIDLEEYAAELAEPGTCHSAFAPYVGVAVTLTAGDGTVIDEWRDEAIPPHRFCPTHYLLSDVLLFEAPDSTVAVVILTTAWPFLEGAEARYTAIALRPPR
jgi:predicted secreted protein